MVAGPGSDDRQVFLNSCLLEGDTELEKRTRRGKRRALLLSILLQLLVVAALVLIPLLSRGENLTSHVIFNPPVPIGRANPNHDRDRVNNNREHRIPSACRFCAPPAIPTRVFTGRIPGETPLQDGEGPVIPGAPLGDGVLGGDSQIGVRTHVEPPPPDNTKPATIRRSEIVQAAMLIYRVQPTYPFLAIQLHREGRVELHAIIATDGCVQFVEVISGDPLFISSATSAVHQWRYRPTILNGQPVEVDTHVTVIYTLNH